LPPASHPDEPSRDPHVRDFFRSFVQMQRGRSGAVLFVWGEEMRRILPGGVSMIVGRVTPRAVTLPTQAAARESSELDGQVAEDVDSNPDGEDATGGDFEATTVDVDLGAVAPGGYDASRAFPAAPFPPRSAFPRRVSVARPPSMPPAAR